MFNRKLKERINELSLENFKLDKKVTKLESKNDRFFEIATRHELVLSKLLEANILSHEIVKGLHKDFKLHLNTSIGKIENEFINKVMDKKPIQKPRKQIKKK